MTRIRMVLAGFVVTLVSGMVAPASALIGFGVHYGMDFSLSLDNVRMEQLTLPGLNLDAYAADLGTAPAGVPSEIPSLLLPIYINRTGFERTVFNLGGKVLIDALKSFDIEASANFGVWEYKGEIVYPRSMTYRSGADPTTASSPEDLFIVDYDTLAISCEALDIDYLFLDFTPYAKLHFDVTIKKTFLKVPKRMQTLQFYAGAGASLHLATPVLSAGLIDEVLKESFGTTFATVQSLGEDFFGDPKVMDAVLEKILDGLSEPKWGAHIVAGAQIKIPVIPIAFYIDGKFMIPFGDLDPYAELKGYGFLVNGGIMLKLGKGR